jgi:hypothetical protein
VQILVIALQSDIHADAVVYYLNKKGIEVFRIDPTLDADLPQRIGVIYGPHFKAYYEFQENRIIDLLECNGILCRFAIDSLIATSEDPLVNFSASESLCAFLAPLRMIDSSCWINDPWKENKIDCKVFQSKIAQDVGLKTPEFIISSKYHDLLAFYNEYKNVIIKPLTDTPLALVDGKFIKQKNLSTNDFSAPYTAKFAPIKNCDLKDIDDTPAFLQREIIKKSDIRATIIDNKIFAVEIPYIKGNPIDFRLNKNKLIREYSLQNSMKEKLIELARRLDLRFASCDLVLDNDNQISFLEANVQGNWLWTEINTNLNISENIADALINGKK